MRTATVLRLASSLGVLSLTTLGGAMAQETAQPGGSQQVEEVTVTAERRTESLINVPATVQVITSQQLKEANVQSSLDLSQITPGVTLDPRGAFAQPTIRGIGTEISGVGNPSNVAIYVDGIYQYSQRQDVFDMGPIDSIQILEGPQGTLYGENATGGAILITTRNPTAEDSGQVFGSVGSFGDHRESLYLTGSLASDLIGNVYVSNHADDGYVRNAFTDDKIPDFGDDVFRAKLQYTPTSNFTYSLAVDDQYYNDPATFDVAAFDGNIAQKKNNPGLVVQSGYGTIDFNFDPIQKTRTEGATGRGDLTFPGIDITSLTGWRYTYGFSDDSTTYGPLGNGPVGSGTIAWQQKEQQFSQELDFASTTTERLDYLGGVTVMDLDGRYPLYLVNGTDQSVSNIRTLSYSAFGDLTFHITDDLSLDVGARYTAYRAHYNAVRFTAPADTVDTHLDADALTPRAVLKYQVTGDTQIYASYNKGFKDGGFNIATANLVSAPAYLPEKIDGYEAGIKSLVADNLNIEGAGFYYDYTDIQVSSSNPGGNYVYNAAAARVWGGDVDATYQWDDLSLNAGVAYTNGRYTNFPKAIVYVPNTACGAGVVPPCGNLTQIASATGNTMVRAPAWTSSIGANYTHSVPTGAINVAGNLYYSSGFFADPNDRLEQPAYAVLDMSLSYMPNAWPVKLAVYGRNLTNAHYAYNFIDSAAADQVRWAMPLNFGVSLEWDF